MDPGNMNRTGIFKRLNKHNCCMPAVTNTRRGYVRLTLGETNMLSVNGTIHNHLEHDSPDEERTTIWGAHFEYRLPYYVRLDRGGGINDRFPRRWVAYPVTPRLISVKRIHAPSEMDEFGIEARAGTWAYRHWLGHMTEHLSERVSMAVHVFQVGFVFEYKTEEYRYRLWLRRLRRV